MAWKVIFKKIYDFIACFKIKKEWNQQMKDFTFLHENIDKLKQADPEKASTL